jgi:hypothetical protein
MAKIKKFTEILHKINEGTGFKKTQVTDKDIDDRQFRFALVREKFVTKDCIGRFTITHRGLCYLGIEKYPTRRMNPQTLKNLRYVRDFPNLKSREYRNQFDMNDAQFTQFAIRYQLVKKGKARNYTYSLNPEAEVTKEI